MAELLNDDAAAQPLPEDAALTSANQESILSSPASEASEGFLANTNPATQEDPPAKKSTQTPKGTKLDIPAEKLKPQPELDFFAHNLLAKLNNVGEDRSLAGINMAAASTGRKVAMPKRADAEQSYVKLLQKQGQPYDADAKKQFEQYYKDAERSYRDFETGNFNALNVKTASMNSALNNKLGIFTNNQTNTTRSHLPTGVDMRGGMVYNDERSMQQIVSQAVNGSGTLSSSEFVQSDAFEDIMKDKFNRDGKMASYNNTTKEAVVDKDGKPVFKQYDSLGLGDGQKIGVDENGEVYPILVRAEDDAYGASGIVSDWSYGPASNSAAQLFKRLSAGVVGNVVRVGGSALQVQQTTGQYIDNLLGVNAIQTEPFKTGYQPLDSILESAGFVKPVGLDWSNQASFTDRLLGQGYETQDSKLAKQMLLAGKRMTPGLALDEGSVTWARS
jgi:hypothetical protein